MSKPQYSELEMGNAFEAILASESGLPGVGVFDRVFREVSSRQGRPDFIGLRSNHGKPVSIPSLTPDIGVISPSILSLLKKGSPRTLKYLVTNLDFDESSIRKHLSELKRNGAIQETPTGAYLLSSDFRSERIELWSFELKISGSRRALSQAQQSRAYSDHAVIVVPVGGEHCYQRYHAAMKIWGISLATFDMKTGAIEFVHRTRPQKAISRTDQMYVLTHIGL